MEKEKSDNQKNNHPKYDCDDCKYYPCTHHHIKGTDAKIKYNICGDHSSRGCP